MTGIPLITIHADNSLIKAEPFGSAFKDDPFFKDFQKMQADMDKIFENFHKRAFSRMPMMHIPSNLNSGFPMRLKTDITDKGNHYEVLADLPNIDQSKIEVKSVNGILSISAQSESKHMEKRR